MVERLNLKGWMRPLEEAMMPAQSLVLVLSPNPRFPHRSSSTSIIEVLSHSKEVKLSPSDTCSIYPGLDPTGFIHFQDALC